MNKKISIVAFVLLTLGVHSIQAQAAIIGFNPSSQTVELGDNVSVDLTISGLGADVLTGFDLDVSFDDSVPGFAGFDFGTELDAFGLGGNIDRIGWIL